MNPPKRFGANATGYEVDRYAAAYDVNLGWEWLCEAYGERKAMAYLAWIAHNATEAGCLLPDRRRILTAVLRAAGAV